MKLTNYKPYADGYNSILTKGQCGSHFAFGIMCISGGEVARCELDQERAFVLLSGKAVFEWSCGSVQAARSVWRDDTPSLLCVGRREKVSIKAISDHVDIAVISANVKGEFSPPFLLPESIGEDVVYYDKKSDKAIGKARYLLSEKNCPSSTFLIREEIIDGGYWGNYLANQAATGGQLGFFRFYPNNGFGIMRVDTSAFVIEQDTAILLPPLAMCQNVSAPGYLQYGLWVGTRQ